MAPKSDKRLLKASPPTPPPPPNNNSSTTSTVAALASSWHIATYFPHSSPSPSLSPSSSPSNPSQNESNIDLKKSYASSVVSGRSTTPSPLPLPLPKSSPFSDQPFAATAINHPLSPVVPSSSDHTYRSSNESLFPSIIGTSSSLKSLLSLPLQTQSSSSSSSSSSSAFKDVAIHNFNGILLIDDVTRLLQEQQADFLNHSSTSGYHPSSFNSNSNEASFFSENDVHLVDFDSINKLGIKPSWLNLNFLSDDDDDDDDDDDRGDYDDADSVDSPDAPTKYFKLIPPPGFESFGDVRRIKDRDKKLSLPPSDTRTPVSLVPFRSKSDAIATVSSPLFPPTSPSSSSSSSTIVKTTITYANAHLTTTHLHKHTPIPPQQKPMLLLLSQADHILSKSRAQDNYLPSLLDLYLHSILTNIPELAVEIEDKIDNGHGGDGNGSKFDLKREEIPFLDARRKDRSASLGSVPAAANNKPSPESKKNHHTHTHKSKQALFDPQLLEHNASMLLKFLRENCISNNTTYILRVGRESVKRGYRDDDDDDVYNNSNDSDNDNGGSVTSMRLYNVTRQEEESRGAWYAERQQQQKSKKHSATNNQSSSTPSSPSSSYSSSNYTRKWTRWLAFMSLRFAARLGDHVRAHSENSNVADDEESRKTLNSVYLERRRELLLTSLGLLREASDMDAVEDDDNVKPTKNANTNTNTDKKGDKSTSTSTSSTAAGAASSLQSRLMIASVLEMIGDSYFTSHPSTFASASASENENENDANENDDANAKHKYVQVLDIEAMEKAKANWLEGVETLWGSGAEFEFSGGDFRDGAEHGEGEVVVEPTVDLTRDDLSKGEEEERAGDDSNTQYISVGEIVIKIREPTFESAPSSSSSPSPVRFIPTPPPSTSSTTSTTSPPQSRTRTSRKPQKSSTNPLMHLLLTLHKKLISLSLLLARHHLEVYDPSGFMQALRFGSKRVRDLTFAAGQQRRLTLRASTNTNNPNTNTTNEKSNGNGNGDTDTAHTTTPDPDLLSLLLLKTRSDLWNLSADFCRSFFKEGDKWRDIGHAGGDDIIGTCRELEDTENGYSKSESDSDSAQGSGVLGCLGIVIGFEDDTNPARDGVQDRKVKKAVSKAGNELMSRLSKDQIEQHVDEVEDIFKIQSLRRRDESSVLCSSVKCYQRSLALYTSYDDLIHKSATLTPTPSSSPHPLNSPHFLSLNRKLGDVCNELGKICLHACSHKPSPPSPSPSQYYLPTLLRSALHWFNKSLVHFTLSNDCANLALLRCNAAQTLKFTDEFEVAILQLLEGHSVLRERDYNAGAWDAVSGSLAATYLTLGVRRRQELLPKLVGYGNNVESVKKLTVAEEKSIVEVIEKSITIYEELNDAKQNAAGNYQLALVYKRTWGVQTTEKDRTERLRKCLKSFEIARMYFDGRRGEECTFVILCCDLAELFMKLNSATSAKTALQVVLDTANAFCRDVVKFWKEKAGSDKEWKVWKERMSLLISSMLDLTCEILMWLIKSKVDDKLFKEVYRDVLVFVKGEGGMNGDETEFLAKALFDEANGKIGARGREVLM